MTILEQTESIEYIMTNWQPSTDNLVVTTTDNSSNFVAAFNSTVSKRLICLRHLKFVSQECLGKSQKLVELWVVVIH